MKSQKCKVKKSNDSKKMEWKTLLNINRLWASFTCLWAKKMVENWQKNYHCLLLNNECKNRMSAYCHEILMAYQM